MMFASKMYDKFIQARVSRFRSENRPGVEKSKMYTDHHPFSLMEGIAGEVCFLSDLLHNPYEARFPGYEV